MFLFKNSSLVLCSCFQQGRRLYYSVGILTSNLQDAYISSFRGISTSGCQREEEEINKKMIEYGIKEEKSSKAMRAYLERSEAYNKFMAKEEEEYKTGKRHLANMMGRDPENFTQKDVDEAISYLFPSGLFVKKTRPFLKPPSEVHPPKKEAEFDSTGRPHHYLFYTGKPNFYEFLHKLVDKVKELNKFEDTMIRKQLKPDSALKLDTEGYQWLSKESFEEKFLEKISEAEFRHLISTLDRLVSHPYSYRIKEVIFEARAPVTLLANTLDVPKPELHLDGREFITFSESKRKTAFADVTVYSPGTGQFTINGNDLSYFWDFQSRDQLLFPLHFSEKLNTVDVLATVRGGGYAGQAGAIRYALSMCLRSFVDAEMIEKMRLAGLLTRDKRRRERKKPGQARARRKFTWKKR